MRKADRSAAAGARKAPTAAFATLAGCCIGLATGTTTTTELATTTTTELATTTITEVAENETTVAPTTVAPTTVAGNNGGDGGGPPGGSSDEPTAEDFGTVFAVFNILGLDYDYVMATDSRAAYFRNAVKDAFYVLSTMGTWEPWQRSPDLMTVELTRGVNHEQFDNHYFVTNLTLPVAMNVGGTTDQGVGFRAKTLDQVIAILNGQPAVVYASTIANYILAVPGVQDGGYGLLSVGDPTYHALRLNETPSNSTDSEVDTASWARHRWSKASVVATILTLVASSFWAR